MKFIEELIPIQFLSTVKGYVKINMIDEAIRLLQWLTGQGYKKAHCLISLLHVYLFCRDKDLALLNRALLDARTFVTAYPEISEGWWLLGEVLLLESFFCDEAEREKYYRESQETLHYAALLLKEEKKTKDFLRCKSSLDLLEQIKPQESTASQQFDILSTNNLALESRHFFI